MIKLRKLYLKKSFTENDYWNGDIPEDKFDEALNKYGYEYTPTSSWTSAHDVPEDYKVILKPMMKWLKQVMK